MIMRNCTIGTAAAIVARFVIALAATFTMLAMTGTSNAIPVLSVAFLVAYVASSRVYLLRSPWNTAAARALLLAGTVSAAGSGSAATAGKQA